MLTKAAKTRMKRSDARYGEFLPQIVRMRRDGANYEELARWLNNHGYRNHKGNAWTGQAVRNLLCRTSSPKIAIFLPAIFLPSSRNQEKGKKMTGKKVVAVDLHALFPPQSVAGM
jgi:hypothetical protein